MQMEPIALANAPVDETRFTLPNSPNNVNIMAATARRVTGVHADAMKKIAKRGEGAAGSSSSSSSSDHTMEVLQG